MATETKIVLTAQDKTRAAVDSAKRNLAGLQAQGAKLNAVMGTLAGAGGLGTLAGGLSAGAFVGFVKSVTDSVDALNDVSDATGATIENISSLEEVARRTGAGLDTVETALVKMNQALNTASDPNSTAAGALKAIGLSADELKKQDPAEALLAIAQALDGYADDANKARLVQELFGKSLKEVAPLLHDLAEQGKLNATVTEEQAKEAEKFNKQLFELQTNVSNIGRAIALDMLPALNAAGYQFSEQAKQAGLLQGALAGIGELSSPLRTVFETIAVLGINVAYVFKGIGTEVGGMAAQIAALARFDFKGFSTIGRLMKEDAAAARKEVDEFSARLLDRTPVAPKAAAPGSDIKKPKLDFNPYTPPKAPKAPKAKVDKEYDAELEMSRRAAEAYAKTLGQLTDAQHQAEESALDLTPSQRALRDLMADPVWQSMPQTWQQVAIAQTEAAVAAEKMAADQKRLNDLIAATPTAQLEKQREEMQFLADAFERGAITAEQFAEAAGTALGTLPKQAEEAANEMDQFMVQAARNIQDAFAEFLFDPFKDGLGGMLKNFGQVIQRMIAQAVAADLGKRLFGADLASGKAGSSLGGWLGDLAGMVGGVSGATASVANALPGDSLDNFIKLAGLASARGNAFAGAGPVSAFAAGGAFGQGEILTRPTFFRFAEGGAFRAGVAGEAGPEGALPLQRMANGKLGVSAAGIGQDGGDMHIHITVPPGTPAEQRASLAQQARTALGAMNRARRYG